MRYRGRESSRSGEHRQEIEDGLGGQETIPLEEGRDEIEARYDSVYRSKQSYYDFLAAGGLSSHGTEKGNPKRNEEQILERREEIKKTWHRGGKRLSGEK